MGESGVFRRFKWNTLTFLICTTSLIFVSYMVYLTRSTRGTAFALSVEVASGLALLLFFLFLLFIMCLCHATKHEPVVRHAFSIIMNFMYIDKQTVEKRGSVLSKELEITEQRVLVAQPEQEPISIKSESTSVQTSDQLIELGIPTDYA
jgi:hypothetical protein